MLVILARSARYMKLLPFSSDNARSGTRRGALAESSGASRTGREGFVAGFRKAYCGSRRFAPGKETARADGKMERAVAGGKGGAGTHKRPPPTGKQSTHGRNTRHT